MSQPLCDSVGGFAPSRKRIVARPSFLRSPCPARQRYFGPNEGDGLCFVGGNTARSRVQIRWARDRALQISILPLMGVEICRMVLTPDTVYLIDRYHKQYVKESVDEWQGQSSMDISFGSIQSLFWPGRFCREEKPCPTMFRSLMSLSLVRDIDILILPASLLVIIISRSIIGLVSGLFCGIRLLLPVHWCVGMPVIIWSRSWSVLHK